MLQADAFTNSIFGGNPAAVCLLEAADLPLHDDVRQSIAAELNLSETAFAELLPDKKRPDSSDAANLATAGCSFPSCRNRPVFLRSCSCYPTPFTRSSFHKDRQVPACPGVSGVSTALLQSVQYRSSLNTGWSWPSPAKLQPAGNICCAGSPPCKRCLSAAMPRWLPQLR